MASETVSEPVSRERISLALHASWELESIADELIRRSQGADAEDMLERGLSIRIRDLSQVIMSALNDETDTLASMRERLTGMFSSAEEEVSHG